MLNTSANFQAAAIETVRQVKGKLFIEWVRFQDDDSIVVSSSDENRGAQIDQIADGIISIPRKWAHLDGVMKANGTYSPAPSTVTNPDTQQVGWYGATRCDGSNVWAVDPTLTIEFDARPILVLFVSGDDYYNEYPVDFNIKVYAGAVLEHTEIVTGNSGLTWSKDVTVEGLNNITKMVLTIEKWSHPNRIVKISEFYSSFTQTLTGDAINSMNLLEERVIADGSLPIGNISANEIDISLNNISIDVEGTQVIDPFFPDNPNSPYNTFLAKNKKMIPYIGFVLADGSTEYVKLGSFWSGDWRVNEQDATASVTARDRMELLRKAEHNNENLYEDKTLYFIMDSVLQHAKDNIPMDDLTWDIDNELQDYTIPYAWFPKESYFKSIKSIVEACMGQAYMSKEDVLIVEGPSKLII